MLYAIKANRQYPISEEEKPKYMDQGYKIAKLEDGKLVFEVEESEESKEIAALKEQVKTLEAAKKKLETELVKAKGEGK